MKLCRQRRSGFGVEQSDENQDVKKPQLAQDHPQVVAGSAQYRKDYIAQRALEPIAIELAVRLHVSDGWLDCAATPDHCSQATRDTASQTRVVDLHAKLCQLDGDGVSFHDGNDSLLGCVEVAYASPFLPDEGTVTLSNVAQAKA